LTTSNYGGDMIKPTHIPVVSAVEISSQSLLINKQPIGSGEQLPACHW